MAVIQPWTSYNNQSACVVDYLGLYSDPIYLLIQTNLLQLESKLSEILEENFSTKELRSLIDQIDKLVQSWKPTSFLDLRKFLMREKNERLANYLACKNPQIAQLLEEFEQEQEIAQISKGLAELLCTMHDIGALEKPSLDQSEKLIDKLSNCRVMPPLPIRAHASPFISKNLLLLAGICIM